METVRVIYHHEGDGWWAESPDVEGWSAAGDTYAEVAKLAEVGIPLPSSATMPSWSTSSRGRANRGLKLEQPQTAVNRYADLRVRV